MKIILPVLCSLASAFPPLAAPPFFGPGFFEPAAFFFEPGLAGFFFSFLAPDFLGPGFFLFLLPFGRPSFFFAGASLLGAVEVSWPASVLTFLAAAPPDASADAGSPGGVPLLAGAAGAGAGAGAGASAGAGAGAAAATSLSISRGAPPGRGGTASAS